MAAGDDHIGASQAWIPEPNAPDYHVDLARSPRYLRCVPVLETTVEPYVHPAGRTAGDVEMPRTPRIPPPPAVRAALDTAIRPVDEVGADPASREAGRAVDHELLIAWHHDPRVTLGEVCQLSARSKPRGTALSLMAHEGAQKPHVTRLSPAESEGERQVAGLPLRGWSEPTLPISGLYQTRHCRQRCSLSEALASPSRQDAMVATLGA